MMLQIVLQILIKNFVNNHGLLYQTRYLYMYMCVHVCMCICILFPRFHFAFSFSFIIRLGISTKFSTLSKKLVAQKTLAKPFKYMT